MRMRVKAREAGKDGKPNRKLARRVLKEVCKKVQSRLCQASLENAQEHSVPKADDVV